MIFSYCPNCFSHTNNAMCASCGFDQSTYNLPDGALPPNKILNARYLIGKVLGKGGFGITYIAKDLNYNRIVAIKECLPEAYAYRGEGYKICNDDNEFAFLHCKKIFKEEIDALYKLNDNSFVVDVYGSFSENNTEYMVMRYINGKSLKYLTYVQGGKTSIENSIEMFFTIGSALMEIHNSGIIHRDISPENIMFDSDGNIMLIDFGACKTLNGASGNESTFLKPGFAPPEQYDFNGEQGPWTDVYALAATFYTVLSGEPLVDSVHRLEADTMKTLSQLGCPVPDYVSDAVAKAMSPEINKRYKSVCEFLNDMADFAVYANGFDDETTALIRSKTITPKNLDIYAEQSYENVLFPYVEVVSGKHKGEKIKIPDFGFVCLGREPSSCNMILDDYDEISRAHCLVGYDRSKNRFIVIDKSHNGTYYSNNQRMLINSQSFINPDETFYMYSPDLKLKVRLI